MSTIATAPPPVSSASYSETRRHELRRSRMMMVDGNLVSNVRSVEAGACARVYEGGYWGFASSSTTGDAGAREVTEVARRNARAMAKFGPRRKLDLPNGRYRGEHEFRGKAPLSPGECTERLAQINAWCAAQFKGLKSTRLMAGDEHHRKHVANSEGSDAISSIQRALCYVTFIGEDERGSPVEVTEFLSGKGHLGDLDWSLDAIKAQLE